MAKESVKTRKGKEEERKSNSIVAVDRISKLPDPVIYHILSFVPTVYAVRMSLLSRRWRRMWYSVPTLQFSELDGFHKRASFDVFVEKCLMHRSRAMRYIADSFVTSFMLDILYSRDSDRPAVNRWSKSSIIQNNVKELDICGNQVHTNGFGDYMPSVVLNGRSLSIIKLKGLKLDGSCSMNLPSLKSLYLDDVAFGGDEHRILQNLMIGSPSLEKFVLKDCDIDNIKISSSSLKYLEFKTDCKDSLDVDALNLQSLLIDCYGCPRIGFSSCTAIRDLSLSEFCNGIDQNIDNQIFKLTCLENLTLTICEEFDHINILSPTLKCFCLIKVYEQKLEVTTETPNLVSFEYQGDTKFSITIKTLNPQLSGKILFWRPLGKKYDTEFWYTELIAFLTNINCLWNSLSLHCDEKV